MPGNKHLTAHQGTVAQPRRHIESAIAVVTTPTVAAVGAETPPPEVSIHVGQRHGVRYRGWCSSA